MNCYINPAYRNIRDYIITIPSIFDHNGQEIYNQRNVIKVFHAPDGTLLNVKRYHIPALANRIIYSIGLRKPKGMRAWTYPLILSNNGIETPEPVAYIEERQLGLIGFSYFISIQCTYNHTLYEMAYATQKEYTEMAKALAVFAANMHEKGILHRDFTPGNILWEKSNLGNILFSLVDINRMTFGKVSHKKGLLNLIKLWGPKEFIYILTKEYASIRGIPESKALNIVMNARAHFWRGYLKKHDFPYTVEI